jgi:hypothetical protein
MNATIAIMVGRNSDHCQRCLAWSWPLVLMAALVSDQWTLHWRIETIPLSEHPRSRYGAIGGEECSWDNRLAVSVTMSIRRCNLFRKSGMFTLSMTR